MEGLSVRGSGTGLNPNCRGVLGPRFPTSEIGMFSEARD